ncbi:MAG: pyridoxal-phosphate dependent enzyme [Rhodothermales bacterium]|nr:pyridoxal-phosphate dependent enzyme [Rhodothermales bacterium]
MWHESIIDTIGGTPLVRLARIPASLPCTVLAKVEFFNPGASVKDRIGVAMIDRAEKSGDLKPGGTIVEGTSGNTGAGIALAAIARGYRCVFTTTDKQSPEKVNVLRALGAEVKVCPTNVEPDDPRSYYSMARRIAEETPNAVYLNQYDNPANEQAHYESTGPELWDQTDGRITHFVASAGTGGTISGVARYLKEHNSDIQVVGVDTYGSVYYKYFHTGEFDEAEIYPYVTEGAGEDILAGNMNFDLVDDYVRCTDKENMLMTRRLAREEGLFVGQSSGLALCGAMKWMTEHRDELTEDDVVVVLLPDSGFRYLSKTFNDDWMRDHGFLEARPSLTVRQLLGVRPSERPAVAVEPSATLGEAIDRMVELGISQVPVVDPSDGTIVGSLTESDILNRLVSDAAARNNPVADVMGEPMPVVQPDCAIEDLSAQLGRKPGAVLVAGPDHDYSIITKSDLIAALAAPSNNN